FVARIVQEKEFEDTGGARKTDGGVAQIQRQVAVCTQGADAYGGPGGGGGRTAASSRFGADCRFSRKARPPTMFLWPRTRARFSPPICRTGLGIRGQSQDPPASFRQAGTARTTNGARYNCRTDS